MDKFYLKIAIINDKIYILNVGVCIFKTIILRIRKDPMGDNSSYSSKLIQNRNFEDVIFFKKKYDRYKF